MNTYTPEQYARAQQRGDIAGQSQVPFVEGHLTRNGVEMRLLRTTATTRADIVSAKIWLNNERDVTTFIVLWPEAPRRGDP